MNFVNLILVSILGQTTKVFLLPLTKDSRQFNVAEEVYVTELYNVSVCVIDNIPYEDGEFIPTIDPCESCICHPPGFACKIIKCKKPPKGCVEKAKRLDDCCPRVVCDGNLIPDLIYRVKNETDDESQVNSQDFTQIPLLTSSVSKEDLVTSYKPEVNTLVVNYTIQLIVDGMTPSTEITQDRQNSTPSTEINQDPQNSTPSTEIIQDPQNSTPSTEITQTWNESTNKTDKNETLEVVQEISSTVVSSTTTDNSKNEFLRVTEDYAQDKIGDDGENKTESSSSEINSTRDKNDVASVNSIEKIDNATSGYSNLTEHAETTTELPFVSISNVPPETARSIQDKSTTKFDDKDSAGVFEEITPIPSEEGVEKNPDPIFNGQNNATETGEKNDTMSDLDYQPIIFSIDDLFDTDDRGMKPRETENRSENDRPLPETTPELTTENIPSTTFGENLTCEIYVWPMVELPLKILEKCGEEVKRNFSLLDGKAEELYSTKLTDIVREYESQSENVSKIVECGKTFYLFSNKKLPDWFRKALSEEENEIEDETELSRSEDVRGNFSASAESELTTLSDLVSEKISTLVEKEKLSTQEVEVYSSDEDRGENVSVFENSELLTTLSGIAKQEEEFSEGTEEINSTSTSANETVKSDDDYVEKTNSTLNSASSELNLDDLSLEKEKNPTSTQSNDLNETTKFSSTSELVEDSPETEAINETSSEKNKTEETSDEMLFRETTSSAENTKSNAELIESAVSNSTISPDKELNVKNMDKNSETTTPTIISQDSNQTVELESTLSSETNVEQVRKTSTDSAQYENDSNSNPTTNVEQISTLTTQIANDDRKSTPESEDDSSESTITIQTTEVGSSSTEFQSSSESFNTTNQDDEKLLPQNYSSSFDQSDQSTNLSLTLVSNSSDEKNQTNAAQDQTSAVPESTTKTSFENTTTEKKIPQPETELKNQTSQENIEKVDEKNLESIYREDATTAAPSSGFEIDDESTFTSPWTVVMETIFSSVQPSSYESQEGRSE